MRVNCCNQGELELPACTLAGESPLQLSLYQDLVLGLMLFRFAKSHDYDVVSELFSCRLLSKLFWSKASKGHAEIAIAENGIQFSVNLLMAS